MSREKQKEDHVMVEEAVNLTYKKEEEEPIRIDPHNDGSFIPANAGSVTVSVKLITVIEVINTSEMTKFVYLQPKPHYEPSRIKFFLTSLAKKLTEVNGKYFVVLPKNFSQIYSDILVKLYSEEGQDYGKKLIGDNLFHVNLEDNKFIIPAPADEYSIEVVSPDNDGLCNQVSLFQQTILPYFRQLPPDTNLEKINQRYSPDAFKKRVASPQISVFTIKKRDQLLGTLTLNRHQTPDVPESSSVGYLSDLFVEQGLENDDAFIEKLMHGVFHKIKNLFPDIQRLVVMAATNDPHKPIVKCFQTAVKKELMTPPNFVTQDWLGSAAQQQWNGAQQQWNAAKQEWVLLYQPTYRLPTPIQPAAAAPPEEKSEEIPLKAPSGPFAMFGGADPASAQPAASTGSGLKQEPQQQSAAEGQVPRDGAPSLT
jgi:hypothetical protein